MLLNRMREDVHDFYLKLRPHADNGSIRFKNDTIFAAGRTGADDGNIELKFTTQDELDLTNSNNSTVKLQYSNITVQ